MILSPRALVTLCVVFLYTVYISSAGVSALDATAASATRTTGAATNRDDAHSLTRLAAHSEVPSSTVLYTQTSLLSRNLWRDLDEQAALLDRFLRKPLATATLGGAPVPQTPPPPPSTSLEAKGTTDDTKAASPSSPLASASDDEKGANHNTSEEASKGQTSSTSNASQRGERVSDGGGDGGSGMANRPPTLHVVYAVSPSSLHSRRAGKDSLSAATASSKSSVNTKEEEEGEEEKRKKGELDVAAEAVRMALEEQSALKPLRSHVITEYDSGKHNVVWPHGRKGGYSPHHGVPHQQKKNKDAQQRLASTAAVTYGPQTAKDTSKAEKEEAKSTRKALSQARETVILVDSTKATIPLMVVGSGVTVIRFDGVAGNTINTVLQMKDRRYDRHVPVGNCNGMQINVGLRTQWQSEVSPNERGAPGGVAATAVAKKKKKTEKKAQPQRDAELLEDDVSEYDVITTHHPYVETSSTSASAASSSYIDAGTSSGAWANFWDSFVLMFETSAFCQILPSVSMRVSNAPRSEPYYVVLRSKTMYEVQYNYTESYYIHNYRDDAFQCQLEVFIDQSSYPVQHALQLSFSLVLPLLVLLVPLPFFLWRADLIQDYLTDIDFAEWLWFPPYYMRYAIIKGVEKLIAHVQAVRAARKAARQQRRLAERQRQLAAEMERSMTGMVSHSAYPEDPSNPSATPKHEAPLPSVGRGWGGMSTTAAPGTTTHATSTQPDQRARSTGEQGGSSSSSAGDGGGFSRSDSEDGRSQGRPGHQPRSPASTSVRILSNSPQQTTGGGAVMPVPALPQPLPVSVVDQANNSARSFVASASGAANGEAASEGARTDSLHVSATHGASISGTVLPPSSTMVATREEREADDAEREERDNLLAKDKRGRRLNGVDADTMDVLADKPTNSFKRSAARALLFSTTDDGETDDGGVAKGAGGSAAAAAAANGAGSTAEEDEERVCRICREGDEEEPLVAPCCCTGSVRWVHRSCLDHWRVESAKRNIGNVNNCEICKKPFTIGIRRSTLFWQSSKHVVNGVLLFITCFITIFCITTFTHSVIGELSCVATYHKVAYTSMFEFQGLALSLFAYCLIVLMILFSNLVVYSWFRSRPDVEEYVNAMHIIPSFWTRRNVARIVGVSVVLVAQVLSMGYLIKIFMYTTSNIAWTWEISPLLGGIIFTVFMTFCLGFAVQLRERWQQHVNQRATDVVVDSGAAATTTAPAAPGAAGGAAPQGQPAAGDDVVNATGVSGEAANPPHDATSAPFPAEGDRNAAHHRSPVPSQQGVRTVAGAVDVDGSPRSVDHDISVDAAMSPASAVTAQLALTSSSAAGRQGGPEEQGGGRVTSAATAGRDPFATPPEMRVIRAYEYCPPRRAPPPQ